jgi:hypothetical protein
MDMDTLPRNYWTTQEKYKETSDDTKKERDPSIGELPPHARPGLQPPMFTPTPKLPKIPSTISGTMPGTRPGKIPANTVGLCVGVYHDCVLLVLVVWGGVV